MILSYTSTINVVVSGAGNTLVNGKYVYSGTYLLRPIYSYSNWRIKFSAGGPDQWRIIDSVGITPEYKVLSSAMYPPVSGWVSDNSPDPAPTVGGVTISNPSYGDVRRLTEGSIWSKLTSGELRSAKIANRPEKEIWRYRFTLTNCLDIVGSLRLFLETYAAELINITDHKSVTRMGFIITPVIDIVEQIDEQVYELDFEFLVI